MGFEDDLAELAAEMKAQEEVFKIRKAAILKEHMGELAADCERPTVVLLGDDGNAAFIVGKCMKAARHAGWTQVEIDAFVAEATSGDYNNVLQTAMKYFEVE